MSEPIVDVVYTSHNRLAYTMLTLPASYMICKASPLLGKFIIIDHASKDGTREYVRQFAETFPGIELVEREGIGGAWASFIQAVGMCDKEFVAKLDNDIMIYPMWLELFTNTFRVFSELGGLGDEYKITDSLALVEKDGWGYVKTSHIGGVGMWRMKMLKKYPPPISTDPFFGSTQYYKGIKDYAFGWLHHNTKTREIYKNAFVELDYIPSLGRQNEYATQGYSRRLPKQKFVGM